MYFEGHLDSVNDNIGKLLLSLSHFPTFLQHCLRVVLVTQTPKSKRLDSKKRLSKPLTRIKFQLLKQHLLSKISTLKSSEILLFVLYVLVVRHSIVCIFTVINPLGSNISAFLPEYKNHDENSVGYCCCNSSAMRHFLTLFPSPETYFNLLQKTKERTVVLLHHWPEKLHIRKLVIFKSCKKKKEERFWT